MDTRQDLRAKLRMLPADVEAVNDFLCSRDNALTEALLDLVDKYGGVEAINTAADEAGRLDARLARLERESSRYLADLSWLMEQRDSEAFVSLAEYRHDQLGAAADMQPFGDDRAVTLEISALQYFPWLISEARRAIARRELMPARYIRVRNMAEQSAPGGDIVAVAAAMQLIGATHVETLDTRGIDGSNVHLGGAETMAGYFGGIGQPNAHPLTWADEYLHYLTEYGIREVLNVNSGTILVSLLLNKLGVRNEFKVSVFMGVDNAWSALWLLMGARLLAGEDQLTSMAGLNLSNSVEVDTLLACDDVRSGARSQRQRAVRASRHGSVQEHRAAALRPPPRRRPGRRDGTEHQRQARGRRSAVEAGRDHPSDIFDYFLPLDDVERRGLMPVLEANYLDKHAAVNRTAAALTAAGLAVRPASLLHATAGDHAATAA